MIFQPERRSAEFSVQNAWATTMLGATVGLTRSDMGGSALSRNEPRIDATSPGLSGPREVLKKASSVRP